MFTFSIYCLTVSKMSFLLECPSCTDLLSANLRLRMSLQYISRP